MTAGRLTLPVAWDQVRAQDVVFDMDGTLIEGDLGESVFYWSLVHSHEEGFGVGGALQEGAAFSVIPGKIDGYAAEVLLRYHQLLEQGKSEDAYGLVAREIQQVPGMFIHAISKGILSGTASPITQDVHVRLADGEKTIGLTYGARLIDAMHDLAVQLQHAGARCWIVSASPQTVCDAVAMKIGVPLERVVGVQSKNGLMYVPWRNGKVEALQKRGVDQPLIAFGDSEGDYDMLQFAAHGVVIGHHCPVLLESARQHGWMVLDI